MRSRSEAAANQALADQADRIVRGWKAGESWQDISKAQKQIREAAKRTSRWEKLMRWLGW